MKNIFRVFLADAKRLTTNVVAIVIIFGLTILPALYAWFNILSNWDPYGENATSQMHISVYSEDVGITIGDLSLNVGDKVVDGLKANTTIGWIFTDTKDEALDDVYSGKCYAALIVPKNFTEKMISFIGGEPENPQIEYYENSKKNAIATKITSKVKNAVQLQVNTSFVSTLAEVASKSGEYITGSEGATLNLSGAMVDKLDEIQGSLDTYINILNSLALVTDSASGLVDSTQGLLPTMNGIGGTSAETVGNLQSSVIAGSQTATVMGSMVDICLETVTDGLDTANASLKTVNTTTEVLSVINGLKVSDAVINQTLVVLRDFMGDTEQYKKAVADYNVLAADINTFSTDAAVLIDKVDTLTAELSRDISACKRSIKAVKNTFDYEIVPQLNRSVSNVESVLSEAQILLGNIDHSFLDVDRTLEGYQATLDAGTQGIIETRDYIIDVQSGLKELRDHLEELTENEQYQEVVDMLKNDPAAIAEFIASPVNMEEVAVYGIGNYGSAMAPFYSVLALWVGALIVVALVHTHVEEDEALKDVKGWQKFFGRYITFFLIGQAQTLITVLGVLFYIRIYCVHPFLFWLGAAVISMTFTILMYALTYAMGNVGQALAVVIMVIQVAGAGCTFPVEVLPDVFQAIYRGLPFTYAMGALKECVGGMYQMDYVTDLIMLGIFAVGSMILGILLEIPLRGLMGIIDKSKAKSGLMM